MPRRIRKTRAVGLEDINLVPIMSILVILIPMLIFAFTFFEVTVQSVAAPKMGQTRSKPKDEDAKKPLNLTVLINETGFVLKYQDDADENPETTLNKREFPPYPPVEDGQTNERPYPYREYDFVNLHNRLAELKRRFPDEQQVNIGAEMHIPWFVIARAIDAARLQLDGVPFEGEHDMWDYRTAPVKTGVRGRCTRDARDEEVCPPGQACVEGSCREPELLFPNVVFVVAE